MRAGCCLIQLVQGSHQSQLSTTACGLGEETSNLEHSLGASSEGHRGALCFLFLSSSMAGPLTTPVPLGFSAFLFLSQLQGPPQKALCSEGAD